MLNLAILLPEAGMVEKANQVLDEMGEMAVYSKSITNEDAVNEARAALEAGARVVIARGYQAKLIKEYTDIPVVEVRFTAQEIGILIRRAQKMIPKERVHIAIIAFGNMLPDLQYMEELFSVSLTVCMIDDILQTTLTIRDLDKQEDKPDIIIGGKAVCDIARRLGYKAMYYDSTSEAIAEAVRSAKSSLFAMEVERRGKAQLETLIDMSESGIVHIDMDANIRSANRMLERLMVMNVREMSGKPLDILFPQIDMSLIRQILEGRRDSVATTVVIRNKPWILLIAAMEYDGKITGAMLSVRKAADHEGSRERENRMLRYGYRTDITFRDIKTEDESMEEMLHDAEIFALSDNPVLIHAPLGSGENAIAKAIHNNSSRKDGPFVTINIEDINEADQMELLFRKGEAIHEKGALIKANYGTLFIKNVDRLTLPCQSQLLRMLIPRTEIQTDALSMDQLDVRLIVSTGKNLKQRVEEGTFNGAFYYKLNGLLLEIPPLCSRKKDLINAFQDEMKAQAKKLGRRFQITEGGCRKISELEWPGNELQLETFCERLALSAKKRVIDEVAIQKIYQQLYPEVIRIRNEERLVVYDSPEGMKIRELLSKYGGNRALVAKDLGISTTTLWRHMKKHGIEASFRQE